MKEFAYFFLHFFQRAFLTTKKFTECEKFWPEFKGENYNIINMIV